MRSAAVPSGTPALRCPACGELNMFLVDSVDCLACGASWRLESDRDRSEDAIRQLTDSEGDPSVVGDLQTVPSIARCSGARVQRVPGFVAIWRIADQTLVDWIPVPFPSDAMRIDDDRLAVAILHAPGRTEWRVVDIHSSAVVDRARDSIVRGFAADECVLYRIDPCPTLAQIRAR